RQELGEQLVNLVDERLHLILVLAEPVEVEPVRPDLPARCRDQRTRLRLRGDLVECVDDRAHPVRVEAVLVVAEVKDPDVTVVVELWHRPGSVTLVGSWTGPDTASRST